jgi:hypothetical protein
MIDALKAGIAPLCCESTASAVTAWFGAIARPLADARGSVQSHDREEVVAGNGTESRGHSASGKALQGRRANRRGSGRSGAHRRA